MFLSFFFIMGTVSLLQRWERENAKLPQHLQRTAPEKPSSPLTVEQWNAFAWEASQVRGWALNPLEKLLVSQLIKFTEMDEKFKVHCTLYSSPSRQFLGLSQINPLYATSCPISWNPVLIFVFHLHLVPSCGLFTLGRPNKCMHSSAFLILVCFNTTQNI